MTKATARAHPNIAFVKYWGNHDHALRLPSNSSISMNLAGLNTETTVEWDSSIKTDHLVMNGQEQHGDALIRVSKHLDALRERFAISLYAMVTTRNNFPTGAGIASSASAFAALTVAGAAALGKTTSERELTTLARLGSGSAARSIPTGYVEWHAATRHEESYAESVFSPQHWGLVDIVAVVNRGHKATGSTAGHASASTSDLQKARVAGARERLTRVKQALAERDFAVFAQVVEHDSNLMHAVMMTSQPPLFYWMPNSLLLMERIRHLRNDGLRVCYTLDAGPNVHCICIREDAEQVRQALASLSVTYELIVAEVGEGTQIVASK